MIENTREKWIDNAKGIAILLVMAGHLGWDLEGWFNFKWVYGFHLVAFFLLAGYNMRQRPMDRAYFQGKFKRLMVPYFWSCLFVMVMDVINARVLFGDKTAVTATAWLRLDFVRTFFGSGGNTWYGANNLGGRIGAAWFLPAMFIAVVIFQFLLNRIKNDLVLGGVCAAVASAGILSGKVIWFPYSVQGALEAVFFIWLGYEIRKYALLERVRWYHYIAALLILLAGIKKGWCSIQFASASVSDVLLSIPVALAGCLLIYLLAIWDRRGKFLAWLGRISLTVFLVHSVDAEVTDYYFAKIFDKMGLSGNLRVWAMIVIEGAAIIIAASVIELLKGRVFAANRRVSAAFEEKKLISGRNVALDIVRGLAMISIITVHTTTDALFRSILVTVNLPCFILISGYFYKRPDNLRQNLWHLIKKTFIPYLVMIAVDILLSLSWLNWNEFWILLRKYAVGMSFTDRVWPEIASVGPAYFILLLFLTRVMFTLIDRFVKNPWFKTAVVIGISVLGMWVGGKGFWLPWSFDCSCWALVLYGAGVLLRKYDILNHLKSLAALYFVLMPVWVYECYHSNMLIAIRDYGNYGLSVVGCICGFLLWYMLAYYIQKRLPILTLILAKVGKASLYMLLFTTLFDGRIKEFLGSRVFTAGNLSVLVADILIHMAAAVLISFLVSVPGRLRKAAKI